MTSCICKLVLGLTALGMASCRVTPRVVTEVAQTESCDRLEIIYRAHPASGPVFAPRLNADDLNQPGEPPFLDVAWSKAELRIEYPHPDGRTDVARASLRFSPVECGGGADEKWGDRLHDQREATQVRRNTRRERWSPSTVGGTASNEFSEIELPRDSLDAILADLNDHGFFGETGRPAEAASQLEVRVNRRWTARSWDYVPSLDDLTTRVYQEGTRRPTAAISAATRPVMSMMSAVPQQ